VRLGEKGGKRHATPSHHNLEEYLIAYLDGASLRDDPKGPLFRTNPQPTHAAGLLPGRGGNFLAWCARHRR
jgi:hypothetical protein